MTPRSPEPPTLYAGGDDFLPRGRELLDRLAEAVGVDFDPVRAGEALRRVRRQPDDPPEDGLAQAAGDVGLRLTAGVWSVREALALVGPGAPVLAWAAEDGGPTWLLILDRQGRKAHVLQPGERKATWMSERALARYLGATDLAEPLPFWTAQATVPAAGLGAGIRDDHGDHGGHDGHGGHGGDDGHHGHGTPPLRRLLGLLRAERRDLWVVLLFAVGVGLLSLATPIAVEAIVGTVQGGSQLLLQPVVVLTLVLLGCLGLAAVLRGLKTYVVEFLQQRIFVRVVADLAHRLPRVRAEAFDAGHGPEVVNRFFDVLTVQKAGAVLLLDGVVVVLQASIGLLVLAFYHPFLLGFDLALLIAIALIIFVAGRGAVRTSIRESYAKYAVAGWLEEMVRHPNAFKLAGVQEYALERADGLTRTYLRSRQAHFRILFRQIALSLGLQALAAAALLGLGGWLVIQRSLTLGQLVAAELIVTAVVGSFVKLGKSLESYYDLLAAVDKVGHLIDLPLERGCGEDHDAPDGPATLNLHHVHFAYPGGHHPVLNNVNLRIRPGERLAIYGVNGSGKTTLAELIYCLREPTEGHITLDGVDVRDLRLESLREHVAVVSGHEVFEGTVAENVRAGRHHLSLSHVRAALDKVGLLEHMQALPAGLQTRLTTGGSPLSQGQARRLMLARALAGSPRLLVLDEALQDLDAVAERHVLESLFDREAPWTLVVITHDVKIAEACDRRLVLADGTLRGNAWESASDLDSSDGGLR